MSPFNSIEMQLQCFSAHQQIQLVFENVDGTDMADYWEKELMRWQEDTRDAIDYTAAYVRQSVCRDNYEAYVKKIAEIVGGRNSNAVLRCIDIHGFTPDALIMTADQRHFQFLKMVITSCLSTQHQKLRAQLNHIMSDCGSRAVRRLNFLED